MAKDLSVTGSPLSAQDLERLFVIANQPTIVIGSAPAASRDSGETRPGGVRVAVGDERSVSDASAEPIHAASGHVTRRG